MDKLLEIYIKKENNIFQSQIWQEFQSKSEHDTFWISSNDGDVLLIKMPLYKNLSYLYCPRAPQVTEEGWKLFLNKAREIARREKAIFVRVEPFKVQNGLLSNLGFKRVSKYSPLSKQFSPMSTLLLDIDKSDEILLSEMKSKWRYNIRLAEKKGVTVRQSESLKDLKKFFNLSVNMKERGFSAHSFEHYKNLFESLVKNKAGKLFVAECEGEILAVLMVVFCGEVAIYLHGASSDTKRELMPNHLAQWEAIKEAKRRKCKVYDFWGVAPLGAKNHNWEGISRFKIGFGGERIQFLGAFDCTFSKIWYIIFCLANFVRKVLKR